MPTPTTTPTTTRSLHQHDPYTNTTSTTTRPLQQHDPYNNKIPTPTRSLHQHDPYKDTKHETSASLSRAHQNGCIMGMGTPLSNMSKCETFETAPQAWAPCGALGSSVERLYRRVLHLLLPLSTALLWQGVWAATTTFGEEAGVEASIVVCVPLRPPRPCHPEKNLKNAEEGC